MKQLAPIKKLILVSSCLLLSSSVHAADLFYKKNLSLYVIHDVDQGKSESQLLESSVRNYVADAGAVIFVKGQTLYLIRDTREPKAESLDTGVADFKLKDGLIAYIKGESLYVRRVTDAANVSSRLSPESHGATNIDIAGGVIIFIKNSTTLYRVTDIERGAAERVIYPVGEAQVSGK
ncbi:MAG: hypothetical protein V4727_00815 [Verrucomicrobiota bacterium]